MSDPIRMSTADALLAQLNMMRNVLYAPASVPRIPRQQIPCQSCNRWGNAWDHCHTHGWIRGLVCGRCNLLFAEFDHGERPYFTTDDDLERWHSWRLRCGGCDGRLRHSTEFRTMTAWVLETLAT